ncbi:hypothetical protein GN958_ATG17261, partial [Phytophthora infestans]
GSGSSSTGDGDVSNDLKEHIVGEAHKFHAKQKEIGFSCGYVGRDAVTICVWGENLYIYRLHGLYRVHLPFICVRWTRKRQVRLLQNARSIVCPKAIALTIFLSSIFYYAGEHIGQRSVTVSSDGVIAHLFGPAESRSHDLTLLDTSNPEKTYKDGKSFHSYLLHGDPAYGHTNVSRFDRVGVTHDELMYTRQCASVNIRGMRIWADNWSVYVEEAAAILSNCLIVPKRQNVVSSCFDVFLPRLEVYFA